MSVADPKCFIRLKEPIPGIDHIKFLDQRQFAEAHHLIDRVASQLDVDRLNDFYVYLGEHGSHRIRWHAAADGLVAFRAIREYIESHESLDVAPEYRESVLNVLARLTELLEEASSRAIPFCVVGNY